MNFATSLKGDFDPSYKKRDDALIAGAVLLVFIIWGNTNNLFEIDKPMWWIAAICRILAAIWAWFIAEEQNRDKNLWLITALFFPPLSLIVLGLSKKRRFQLVIDVNPNKEKLYRDLKSLSQKLIAKKKYAEAQEVYEYIVSDLACTEEDNQVLMELRKVTTA